MDQRLHEEYITRVGRAVSMTVRNTPAPEPGSDAEIYYIRLQEVLETLRRNGIVVTK